MSRKISKKEQPPQQLPAPNDRFSELVASLKTDLEHFISTQPVFQMKEVYSHFEAVDKKLRTLYYELVTELVEERKVIRNTDGRYRWLTEEPAAAGEKRTDGLTGRVDHVNRNFAYVVIEGREKDILVDTDDLKGATDGDTVRVQLYNQERNGHPQGRVREILERSRKQLVGTLENGGRHALVKPDNRKIYDPIEVTPADLNGAVYGDKVIVTITTWPTRTRPALGEVARVLGKSGEHNTEMHAILAEFELPVTFPEAVEQEAAGIPSKLTSADRSGRRDFRKVTTFTIDPVDAKDFDDALSVQYLANGNLEIGVHIADVSHYVVPGSALDQEAYRRGTSVYLVDRTVPMLPEKLSNNLCSLRPDEDRPAFSAVFEMTPEGKLLGEWFGRTLIHSDRRFTYEEAQEILESGVGEFQKELTTFNGLALLLRKERFRNGAVNFDTIEVKFQLDEAGKPLGIYQRQRKEAHKLVEEFMLLANKRVAEYVHGLSRKKADPNTMVYRIHDSPDPDKLETFATFVARLGYKLDTANEKKIAKSFNTMLEKAEGTAEQNLLETLAVRTMAKARYSTEDTGHFGLAFRRYTHFTSPIRRYPDLVAHRLLQHYLDKGTSVEKEHLEKDCKHCSDRERLASDAERASVKYKQVEYMALQDPSRVYEGVISGVTEFGIFVEITEMASEGLVRMNDLKDDYYELDKENYRLVGERTKRIFTFGDRLSVKVKETNLARRSIDFILADSSAGEAIRKSGGRRQKQVTSGKVKRVYTAKRRR